MESCRAQACPAKIRGGGFEYGGWLVPYADEDMVRLETESFGAADAFLLGRRTYEILAAYWLHHEEGDSFPDSGPMAEKLNRLPKYVVSTTLNEVTWNNSTLIAGDFADEVAKLKHQPGKELQVHGSGDLVQTLMRYDLVDEYRLWICPLVLGGGRRLFGDDSAPTALKLVDTKTTGSGAVLHVYHPAGKPTHGSFAPEH
jgi:dihydrofolate reductase